MSVIFEVATARDSSIAVAFCEFLGNGTSIGSGASVDTEYDVVVGRIWESEANVGAIEEIVKVAACFGVMWSIEKLSMLAHVINDAFEGFIVFFFVFLFWSTIVSGCDGDLFIGKSIGVAIEIPIVTKMKESKLVDQRKQA